MNMPNVARWLVSEGAGAPNFHQKQKSKEQDCSWNDEKIFLQLRGSNISDVNLGDMYRMVLKC